MAGEWGVGLSAIRGSLASGRTTAQELLELQLADARRRNRRINAFRTLRAATELTGEPLGVLAGASFAVKDVFDVAGGCCRFGLSDYPCVEVRRPARIVQTLLDAGAALFGVTNMDALGLGDGPATGALQVLNPVDPTLSPGGSSSGSAAAVAARMCTFALGTDCGGSVRGPAAQCGIVGFKPTQGSLPSEGIHLLSRTCDTPGILALNVADTMAIHAVLTGTAEGPASPRTPPTRLAFVPPVALPPLNEDVRRAYTGALAALRAAGSDLVEMPLGRLLADGPGIHRTIVGHEFETDFLPGLHSVAWSYARAHIRNAGADPIRYREALEARADLAAMTARAMHGCPALLLPTQMVMTPNASAAPHDAGAPPWLLRMVFNLLGWPALSLPASPNAVGVSPGLQLVAQAGHDAGLLQAARTVEEVLSGLPGG